MSGILFVSSNRIGDAVLSTAVLRHYLDQCPDAQVTVAAGEAALSLFEGVPQLEDLIPLIKAPMAGHWGKLWCRTVNRSWDLVVDMRGSALAFILRSRRRVRPRAVNETEHRLVQYARFCGVDRLEGPKIWLTNAHRQQADAFLGDRSRPLLAVGPTANWRGKIWPDENFAELIVRLTGTSGPLPGARVLLCGAAHERAQIKACLAAVPDADRLEVFGALSLPELSACLSRADLYVGNDSGLMHLAAASLCPTLGLFGPSREKVYAPWGPRCRSVRTPESFDAIFPPGYDRHTTPSLMTGLRVDRVEAAAVDLLNRSCKEKA